MTTPGGTSATSGADQFTFSTADQSIVVTTNSDAVSHTGISLRDAIAAANLDAASGVSDTITFSSALNGQTISLVQGPMTLTAVNSSVTTIDGAGQITVDGGNWQRFLIIDAGVNVDVNGLVIQNMNYGLDAGAGILSSGNLTVTNTTFYHCDGNGGGALCNGGDFEAGGTLIVMGCTFTDNTCNGVGGGIGNINSGPGVVTVSNCSFSANNSAAIVNDTGKTMTVTNSTFVGNANTFGIGGAISNAGTITISDCTVSGNTEEVGSGGGIGNSGTMTLLNTVVANNTAGTDPDFATTGGTLTGSYDIVGNGTGMTGITNGVNNNQVGTSVNPLVVPISGIGSFGGPLQTALLLNSTNPGLNTGGPITSLQADITSTSSSLTLTNGAALASNAGSQSVIQIDNEQMLVSCVSANNFNIITRGYNGTTPANHSAGASIFEANYQTTEPRLFGGMTDVGAAQDVTVSFTSVPSYVGANTPFTLTLSAIDQQSVAVGNLPITLHISSGTLGGTTTTSTLADGTATFFNLSIAALGTYTISAYVNDFLVATTGSFSVITAPTVTGISPNQGPTAGGTVVAITGTNFTSTSTVIFGITPATSVTVNSATSITAVAPAEAAGLVDVRVANNGVESAVSSADEFTYNAVTSTSLSSNPVGPITQGTSITFTASVTGSPSVGAVSFYYDYGAAGQFQIGAAVNVSSGSATSAPTTALPAGSDTITAIYTGGTGFQGSTGTLTIQVVVPPPPSITSVVINQDISALYNAAGQPAPGSQRSMVEDVVYTFSEAVNIASPAVDPNVFTIAVAPGWTGTVPTTVEWAPVPGSGSTQWEVDFGGVSIANGAYTITVSDPASISEQRDNQTLTLAASGIGSATQSFYRLFGDINGDQFVNAADNYQLKIALMTYNAAFDYYQYGVVNACDNWQFKADQTVNFSGFTATI